MYKVQCVHYSNQIFSDFLYLDGAVQGLDTKRINRWSIIFWHRVRRWQVVPATGDVHS